MQLASPMRDVYIEIQVHEMPDYDIYAVIRPLLHFLHLLSRFLISPSGDIWSSFLHGACYLVLDLASWSDDVYLDSGCMRSWTTAIGRFCFWSMVDNKSRILQIENF